MHDLQIVSPNSKFPVGWHAVMNEFILDLLAVEYFYGTVLASVRVEMRPIHPKLHVWLLSEAPRPLHEEATKVLDQIHRKVLERIRVTCSICGSPASGALISQCDRHSDTQLVPYAGLQPMANPAWGGEDFQRLIEGATKEDLIRAMAGNQLQMDAATAFVKDFDAPVVSQFLSQAHAIRALGAVESVLRQ